MGGLGFNYIRRTRCGCTCRVDTLKPQVARIYLSTVLHDSMGTPVRRGASKYSIRYLTLSTGTGLPGQHDKRVRYKTGQSWCDRSYG